MNYLEKFERLDNSNYLIYCAKHYKHVNYHTDEFFEDVNRVMQVRKNITRYINSNKENIKEHMILNQIIVLNNVFGYYHLAKILYFKMPEYFSQIKPFLLSINACPDEIYNVGDNNVCINTIEIPLDQIIVNKLRKIGTA